MTFISFCQAVHVYCWANAMVVQGAITQFAAAFGFLELLMAATYNFTVKFLEMQWQVLHTVSNYATSICCWLLGNISRLVTLLDAHFPGGTIGCGIILLNSVVVIIVVTMFVKKKEEITTCVQNIQQLQKEIEAKENELEKESHKLEQEMQTSEKLNEEINKLQQECEEFLLSNSNLEGERDQRLCVSCHEQEKTILLLPCQHMCLYICVKQCLENEELETCPICTGCPKKKYSCLIRDNF